MAVAADLSDAQVEASKDLLVAFGALMEAFGKAQEHGLDAGAILGQSLRSTMGDDFNQLPPMLRMIF